ncbi:GNAT family N-acetyltransferase [Microbacterium sp. ET2]|uniref:GNAT family N-acetyltransferase n=1 Tax=Microbacterium albipurpureum TaxID=3050384 RepID=UPI00259C8407|nr:GNAT family N-acetyltransferase [Microbacterium sp. ET2 (Ac-2212)]WJL94230.1 GNAT family N-acetyltransferase [Microbacterium sp. ET2 (Ac-2212)]
MTYQILEVAVDDSRAAMLRAALDEDLGRRYGPLNRDEPADVAAARIEALRITPDEVVSTWIAITDDGPVGHVMLRRLGSEWELKRLIVTSAARGRGIGRALTERVIERARQGGAQRVILQTGVPQPESIALYVSLGFTPTPVYEPYRATMPNSLCFELTLDPRPLDRLIARS